MKVIIVCQKNEFNQNSIKKIEKFAAVKWFDSDKTDILKISELKGLAFESSKEKMEDIDGNVFILAPLAWFSAQSLKNNIDIWTDTIISCIQNKPINLVKI